MKKKIVTIGGGSGQPELLRYLKEYPFDLTAIVTMMDNGGSSGILRAERDVLPPGDVRKCMIALATESEELEKKWNLRDHDGHAIGNLEILDAVEKYGSWEKAIASFSSIYGISGTILPVTNEATHLVAILENGEEIFGEENIDAPLEDRTTRIEQIRLSHPVSATKAVIKALEQADAIILTMGDLYTSVLPNLLVSGVIEAIAASQAPIISICNRTSKRSETYQFSTKEYVDVFNRYLAPAAVTHMIVDDGTVHMEESDLFVEYKEMDGVHVMRDDIADERDPRFVSGKKAAQLIAHLCTSL